MFLSKVNLKEHYPTLKYDVNLDIYCPSNYSRIDINRVRPAILIFPGGGYQIVSEREKELVALRFLGFDIATFTLEYSVYPHTDFPYPFIEGYAAIDYIRKNANKWHIDPNQLYIMGFSAGGHLGATLAVHRKDSLIKEFFQMEMETKIDGCIFGYPVTIIDSNNKRLGTFQNLVKSKDEKLYNFYSVLKYIDKDFPRTYVFALDNDPYVPCENTYSLIQKLKENHVEVVSHIYNGKIHGSSLGDRSVYPDDFNINEVINTKNWYQEVLDFIYCKGE